MPQTYNSEVDKLIMSFEPNTIQHLGVKMYSNIPAALAELVANAYDADAKEVRIKLYDNGRERGIVVEDQGNGMSFKEINECFLKIGRNRRAEGKKETPEGRTASGKKGLGKLALFGIGSKIEVETTKLGSNTAVRFDLDWEVISNWDKTTNGPDYTPTFEYKDSPIEQKGTSISILNLKRRTEFDDKYVVYIAESLSHLFSYLDTNFRVWISLNDDESKTIEVTNALKYESLDEQFPWEFPSYAMTLEGEAYTYKGNVEGKILTTMKPLKPGQRGVTLFAHGRLVNTPEFFGQSESSNFFSYATGWLNVDFIDDFEEDVISTDRQSLNWENEQTTELKSFLERTIGKIHTDWREKRKAAALEEAVDSTGINRGGWLSTIPPDKATIINDALDAVNDPDGNANVVTILTKAIHSIAPEYAELHWRYLNSSVSGDSAVERLYKQENYFQAASEAVKLYVERVRHISGSTQPKDYTMMGEVFKRDPVALICLTGKIDDIEGDIEDGHRSYSQGVVMGFKNPVTSHASETLLKTRGLFTEKDCLNVLSLLSHLSDRLDKRCSPLP